ncbi:MAG: hypothetical protein L6Q54_09825 [Leptospiraceae bacterium]|nr:hypothetical protein [Leptospiraceae bacterium]MCK6381524.1 hypothetical protein [Leptospiraceae bacterium]NUM40663.1 hypothetical protein [Leptospiraceae bacterium]
MAEEEKDKLKEHTELMSIALESVKTEDKARELIQGKFQDAYILKLRVDIENRSGAMVAIISKFTSDILVMYSIFGNSPNLRKIRTFEDYSQFSHDLVSVMKSGGVDQGLSENVGRAVYQKLTKATIAGLFSIWEKKDVASTVAMLEPAITSYIRAKRTKVQADVEPISSVKFRYKNVMNGIVNPIARPIYDDPAEKESETESQSVKLESSPVEKEIEELEKGFGRVVICKTVLSPVAGIDFDALQNGQKLLFILPFQTEEEKALAASMGAVGKDGINRPITGTFVKILGGAKNEYHIFAKGPNEVLLRAFEERPVRLAVPKEKGATSQKENQNSSTKSQGSNFPLIVVAGVVVAIAIIIALVI